MRTLKLLAREKIFHARTRARISPRASVVPAPLLTRTRVAKNTAFPPRSPRLERILRERDPSSASAPRTSEGPLIYAVDDVIWLTELYTLVLEAAGCRVKAFNDRAEALAALEASRTKPDLLITDDLGHAMPVEEFMQHCRVVHPTLRILMASGYSSTRVRFSRARPDRFLPKPFTLEELQREVTAALTAQ